MDLQTAREILSHPERAPHQGDFALAGRVLDAYWKAHPEALKPVRLGPLTTDARRTDDCLTGVLDDLREINARLNSKPARRLMRLTGRVGDYSIVADTDGVWLMEQGSAPGGAAQTGKLPPDSRAELMNAYPALKTGPSMMGDATARRYAAEAARAKAATWGESFNAAANKRWRPSA